MVGKVIMKQTKIMNLVAWLVSATTAGYLLPQIAINTGGSIPISPWNIIITLPLIGLVLVAMAIPMFRYRKALTQQSLQKANNLASRPKRLNPFYAVRLVLLAKSISISGSIFTGWHLGLVWLQVTAPVIPTSTLQNVLALIGAIFMTICALIVEKICRIHEDDISENNAINGIKDPGITNQKGEPA